MEEKVSSLGVFYMLISSICFCFMSFGIKLMYTHTNINSFEGVYIRGLVMAILNIAYAYLLKVNVLNVPSLIVSAVLIRTIIGTIDICLNFIANKLLPISIASSLYYTYPIVTSCGGYLILRERISKLEFLGMFTSFAGVLLVIFYSRKGTSNTESIPLQNYIPSIILPFTSTGIYLILRKIGQRVHFLVIPTWFGVVQGLTVTPIWLGMRSSNEKWNITMNGVIIILIMSIGGWLGQLFMNKSLQLEKAGRVAAVGYIQIPLMFLCDAFYFNIIITWPVVLGSVLIIICNFTVGILRMLNMID